MANLPGEKIIDKMEGLLNIASDSTRLKIMYVISQGEKSVSEIVEEVGASQSLVSHQLHVLKKAKLVSSRKQGTHVFYVLADEHINQLLKVVYEHVMEEEQ